LACTAALAFALFAAIGCAADGKRPTQSQCEQTNELAQLACVTAWPHGGNDFDSCVRISTAAHLACLIAAMPAESQPVGVSAMNAGPAHSSRDEAARRWAELLPDLLEGRIPPDQFRDLVGP
jgi:hypothetical protein